MPLALRRTGERIRVEAPLCAAGVAGFGRAGRLKVIWTPPDSKVIFDVMIDRRRLQFYIRPLMQTEACRP